MQFERNPLRLPSLYETYPDYLTVLQRNRQKETQIDTQTDRPTYIDRQTKSWSKTMMHWPLNDDLMPFAVTDHFITDERQWTWTQVILELNASIHYLQRHVIRLHTPQTTTAQYTPITTSTPLPHTSPDKYYTHPRKLPHHWPHHEGSAENCKTGKWETWKWLQYCFEYIGLLLKMRCQ